MITSSARTISSVVRSLGTIRDLRKIKCFTQGRAITIVTYYKDTTSDDDRQYKGQAYIFSYNSWKGTCVALAHTSHLPPPDELETTEEELEQTEHEIDPPPILPGFGFSQHHSLYV